ncbi:MAG: hypothetical protein CVV05_00415 [Gammaproteobacteria bacterium HGW-Gammaproteobacteria-1]|jgi:hypothetical protein|nr:MAG: hypothetical protein CVV05_00415 [Gammaproteobacteria bacterium HGW-Gammaproteobacteria-1]
MPLTEDTSISMNAANHHPPAPLSVNDPEIREVQNYETGSLVPVTKAIGTDYAKAEELRMQLAEARVKGEPLYVCPMCGVLVYLVSMKEKGRFYFRHNLEDGSCPARTRGELSADEINARKYNGAKESHAHIRMKQIVAESLRCDPRFSDVAVEKVWRGQDRASWRKPDVQAIFNGIPVAFEIQLSTTFLHVIAERRVFYLENGGVLCWIFKTYDEDKARLTQDDIFYNNNRNLFLASEDTLKASRATGRFILNCGWMEPRIVDGRIETLWNGRHVGFDELTIDRERQRVFLFDYDKEHERITTQSDAAALRAAFDRYWLGHFTFRKEDQPEWRNLRTKFRQRGLSLPRYPNDGSGIATLISALYSAREGYPVGTGFKRLIEVAHRIEGAHKRFFRLFRHALAVYGRVNQILAEDATGKWREKAATYKPRLAANDPAYRPDPQFNDLVAFLFPELIDVLRSLAELP